jgi:hypothetical protein
MGSLTLFDALVVAPAAALGLAGLWLGFWRAAAAWPIRWLIPLFGASIAALLATLYMAVNRDFAALLYLSGSVGTVVVATIAFVAVLALLIVFMRNLRERVAVWTSQRRVGVVDRLSGGLLGIACGLTLVALLYGMHDALQPEIDGDAPWADGSVSLPYLRSASASVKGAVSEYLPTTGRLRR